MTEAERDTLLAEFKAILDKRVVIVAPDRIEECAYADWLHPMPLSSRGNRHEVSSGFSRDGSGPNTKRYNHIGVDLMEREGVRVATDLPLTDGKWRCEKGLPLINVAPGRCIMVDLVGAMFSLTIEHVVPGVGQVLIHHKHVDRIYVDEGEIYPAGHHIAMVGTTSTDLRHDHFEVHEGRLGVGLKGNVWWKATAIDPEPILRELVAVAL